METISHDEWFQKCIQNPTHKSVEVTWTIHSHLSSECPLQVQETEVLENRKNNHTIDCGFH